MFPELSDFSSLRQRVLDFLFFLLKPEMKYVGRIIQLNSSQNMRVPKMYQGSSDFYSLN